MTNAVTYDYTGSRVLVTGGTSGIGHGIATAFARAGADVTVTGRRASATDYDTDLHDLAYLPLDLGDEAAVDALAARFDALDVLVNNAGAPFPGGRDEWDPVGFADAMTTNLVGAMRLTMGCETALRQSAASGGAAVVNVVSMAAYRAVPMVPGYASAKAGLVAFTANLARRWIDAAIRVNAVAPGLIDTPMTEPMRSMPELLADELRHVPMGRMGSPSDVAGAVLYLASESAAYVTGSTLVVDGGYLTV